jgi:hypothetical protein
MPRKLRIDAPGALHHIIGRGIERRGIFRNDRDREDFLEPTGIAPAEVLALGSHKKVIEARSILCVWAVRESGINQTQLSRCSGYHTRRSAWL